MALQLQISGGCCVFSKRSSLRSKRKQKRMMMMRGATGSPSAVKTNEQKLKLGGSNLEVSRLGIGAWSWGDTSYWNDFERDGYNDGLGDAVEMGLVKAIGVSNYNEKRLRDAHKKLEEGGIPLASNQVNYSLIYRAPEENGVKAACDELEITLIAYSPLAQRFVMAVHFLFPCAISLVKS
ncbi:hypothetical protein Ancab_012807 [Ancistrocladus abbreviatus]